MRRIRRGSSGLAVSSAGLLVLALLPARALAQAPGDVAEAAASAVPVREAPLSGAPELGRARRGQRFVVRSGTSGWLALDWGGRPGFVEASAARPAAGAAAVEAVEVIAAGARVRTSRRWLRQGDVIGLVRQGQRYARLEEDAGWTRIQLDARVGWVRTRAVRVVAAAPALAAGPAPAPASLAAPDARTPVGFTVAFLGDQGLGSRARAVLRLVAAEGADLVLHQGDFEYRDDPARWDAQLDDVLGPSFPYLASVGNHDLAAFHDRGSRRGYQSYLRARAERLGMRWQGELGVRCTVRYAGVLFLFAAPGVTGSGHDAFLRDALAQDDSVWSVCSWHKVMSRMQVGGKGNESGWGVYEAARRGGAIVATAHEHSYSRTHLLSSFERQVVASTDPLLVLGEDDPATAPDEGRSFAFVSGLGGQSIRPQIHGGAWWASVYTRTQGAADGALFGVFCYRGDPRLAWFYFKDVRGRVVDSFLVRSPLGPAAPAPDAPAWLAARAASPRRVDLTWAPVQGEASVRVERRLAAPAAGAGGASFGVVAVVDADVTAWSDVSVEPARGYEYRLVALGEGGAAPPSGVATATTPAEPGAPAASGIVAALDAGDLEVGDTGAAVSDLQARLNVERARRGARPIAVDGLFGPETEGAVAAFQAAAGLLATGRADAATRAALP